MLTALLSHAFHATAGPFCHRALLTLEEKGLPYQKTLIGKSASATESLLTPCFPAAAQGSWSPTCFLPSLPTALDFDSKPSWLLEVNPQGSVPVMKVGATRQDRGQRALTKRAAVQAPMQAPGAAAAAAVGLAANALLLPLVPSLWRRRICPLASGLWTAAPLPTGWSSASLCLSWAARPRRRKCERAPSPTTASRAARRLQARTAPCRLLRPTPPHARTSARSRLPPRSGTDVFPSFVQFLKSTPETATEKARGHKCCIEQPRATAHFRGLNPPPPVPCTLPSPAPIHHAWLQEAALLGALDALEVHLGAGGPYVGGRDVCATDCSLMPKLYHMTVRAAAAAAMTRRQERAGSEARAHTAEYQPALAPRAPPPAVNPGGPQAFQELGAAGQVWGHSALHAGKACPPEAATAEGRQRPPACAAGALCNAHPANDSAVYPRRPLRHGPAGSTRCMRRRLSSPAGSGTCLADG